MTIDIDIELRDDVPIPDAVEQRQSVDTDAEGGVDLQHLADPLLKDANPIDLVDQAIIIPFADDDREVVEV